MKIFTTYRKKIVVILFWLLFWAGASRIIGYEIILPSPSNTLLAMVNLGREPIFWQSVFFSVLKITAGFMLAVGVGAILASVTTVYGCLDTFFSIPMAFIKSVPVASYSILAMFWINSSYLSLFISFVMVLPLVYFSFYEGIKNTDSNLLAVAQVFRMTRYRKIMAVYLPQVIPFVESALSSAVGIAWKSGIAAELIALVNNSVGGRIYAAKVLMNMTDVFAWTVVVVFLNYLMEKILLIIIQRVKKCQFI